MLSIPILLIILILAGSWKFSGTFYEFLVLQLRKPIEEKKKPIHLQAQKAIYKQVSSPYDSIHFIELNGKTHPRYRTIYQHAEYIEFTLDSIKLNTLVTHYEIKVSFNSKLEHNYDIRWEEGIIDFSWKTKIPFEDYPNEGLKNEHFKYLLECHCLCEVWNHYYGLYPELMQHKAMVGTNKAEHEHLR